MAKKESLSQLFCELGNARHSHAECISNIHVALTQIEDPEICCDRNESTISREDVVVEGRNLLDEATCSIVDLQATITLLEHRIRRHPDFDKLIIIL